MTATADAAAHRRCSTSTSALGAKLVPFAGLGDAGAVPHRASSPSTTRCASGAGLFDVSHMGEFEVTGPTGTRFVNRVTSNDVVALEPGGVAVLGAAARTQGTFVDDCTVYRFDDKLMIVVNASNTARAWEHIVGAEGRHQRPAQGHLGRRRRCSRCRARAPRSLLQPLTDTPLAEIALLPLRVRARSPARECFISRTGYTGEDGFELYCRERDTVALWDALTGAPAAQPIGLGARDSLRLEMGYALYGNEIDDTTRRSRPGSAGS